MLYLGLILALSLASTLYGQQLPPCMDNVNKLIEACGTKNSINLKEVIALWTNGTQEPFPPGMTHDSLSAKLCGHLEPFKKCIAANYLQATNGCSQQEKDLTGQMTDSVINGFKMACDGATVDTRQDPCIQDLNKNLQLCYTKNGVSHSYFQMNSTHKRGAIIGETKEEADQFCLVRKDIFGCIAGVIERCPKAKTVLALSNFDNIALEKGVEVLCQNDKIYLQGLNCFQTPPPEATNCIRAMQESIQREAQNELRTGFNRTVYYQNYCRAVATHVMCDINAWKSYVTRNPAMQEQCSQEVLVMKAHFECELIPTPCTTNLTPQLVTNVCNEAEGIIIQHVQSGKTSSGKHENTGTVTNNTPTNTNNGGTDNNNLPVQNQGSSSPGGAASELVASSLFVLLSVVVSFL